LQTAVLDWAEMRAEIVRLGPESFSLVWFGALDHFVVLRDLVPDIPAVVDYDDVEPAKIAAFLAVAPRDVPGQVMRAKGSGGAGPSGEGSSGWPSDTAQRSSCAVTTTCIGSVAGERWPVPNTYPDPGVTAEPSPGAQPEFVLIANYSYKPNIDAARFVARDVLPTVRRVLPNAVVHIAGHESVRWLADLRNIPGIRLTGAFPDVRPFLNGATAVIVPVRYGGGTRLKIIEAWAYSMPVVSTTLGAEGLGARSGVDILLADSADDFAAACVRVASERQLHTQLASAGRRHYESAYRPVVAEQAIAKLLTTVLER
jgi:hypothetical protein